MNHSVSDKVLANKKVACIVHDAGGARQISAMMLQEWGCFKWRVYTLHGSPGEACFTKAPLKSSLRVLTDSTQLMPALERWCPDIILSNPGWGLFPNQFLKAINKLKRRHISFIEHFHDYRQRFGFPDNDWQDNCPESVLVSHESAAEIARQIHTSNVYQLKDYETASMKQEISKYRAAAGKQGQTLLFLSQVVDGNARGDGRFSYMGEWESMVLADLMAHLGNIREIFDIELFQMRCHPARTSEPPESFRKAVEVSGLKYILESAGPSPLSRSLANAKLVVGMNSMALYSAFLCGLPTVSIIPAMAGERSLPLPDRVSFKSFSELMNSSLELLSIAEDENQMSEGQSFTDIIALSEKESCREDSRHH